MLIIFRIILDSVLLCLVCDIANTEASWLRKHKWREILPSEAISGITVLRLSSFASCSRDHGPQYPHVVTSMMITKEHWKTQKGK